MFNERMVLQYVKDQLGVPHVGVELMDDDILELITGRARLKFSTYYPVVEVIELTPTDKDSTTDNRFTIPVDSLTGLPKDIISIEAVYATEGSISELDHLGSYFGVYGDEGMMGGDMMDGINQKLLQPPRYITTFKYYPPSTVEIYEVYNDETMYLKAKVAHPRDLSTVPINQQEIFIENALILVAKNILPIRDKYAVISSPIGQLQLNVEYIREIANREENFFREKLFNAAMLSKRIPMMIG